MSNNLPTVRPQAAAPVSLDDIWKLAQSVAKSGLFGMKTPDQAMALMCIAQAEGRHPALAARDYHIISGSPAKKAEAMQRDFIEAGGKIEWHVLDDKAADATFSHPAGGTVRIRWDQARVAQAGLGSNGMHKKYPRQMLRSRCVSEGVRTVYPMATSGFYVPEEIAAFDRPAAADASPRADLDNFAGQTIDAAPVEIGDVALAAAGEGAQAFRAWWKTLDPDERHMLKPGLAEYQRVAEAADRERNQDDDEDPFGLPPLGSAPEPPAAADQLEQPKGGDTMVDALDRQQQQAAGDRSSDDLIIPMPPDADLAYVARSLVALAEAEPGRRKDIAIQNAAAINRLREDAPELHARVQDALDKRQGRML